MNLYRIQDAPGFHGSHVFRESRWPSLVLGAGLLGYVAAAIRLGDLYLRSIDSIPEMALFLFVSAITAVVGLCGVLLLTDFRASLRPSNWLLRYDASCFMIQFRSFRNSHLPEDSPTIVWIPASEVDRVRRYTREYDRPSSDASVHVREVAIDLRLRSAADTEALRRAIEHEADLPPAGRWVKTKSRHVPVTVPEPGIVRLAWRDPGHRIRPGVKKALAIFGRHHSIEDPTTDAVDLQSLDERQFITELVKLIESGSTLTATTVVRERYSMSLTEARELVDDLA